MRGHSLLNQQPPHIKATIATMAKTSRYGGIVNWLNEQGIDVTYKQVVSYIRTNNLKNRSYRIEPVQGRKAKTKVYVNELLKYTAQTFTIRNIHLYGSSWSGVSVALRKAGLIEAMRSYTPIRWRILATKDELREWMRKEIGGLE